MTEDSFRRTTYIYTGKNKQAKTVRALITGYLDRIGSTHVQARSSHSLRTHAIYYENETYSQKAQVGNPEAMKAISREVKYLSEYG